MRFLTTLLCLPGLSLHAAPGSQELIRMLIEHKDRKLDPKLHAGCSAEMGKTVGEYVAFLLGTLARAEASDTKRLRVFCGPQDPRNTPFEKSKADECRFEVHVSDKAGESPWTYDLRFRLSRDGKKIDPTYLACPGTP